MGESPQYYGFQQKVVGKYILGVERLSEVVEEIKANFEAHWDETEVNYLTRPMDPDYAMVMDYENRGKYVLFTIRNKELELIGHLMYYLGHSTHHKGMLQAKEDAFFIQKDHRGGALASALLSYAEKCLVRLGVKLIGMTDKSPCGGKSLKSLMEHSGYITTAVVYVKEVGGDDSTESK